MSLYDNCKPSNEQFEHLPDFLSGDGGVVPYLLGELDKLPRLHDPGMLALPGGVPILNCTGGEISLTLTLVSEPCRDKLDSFFSTVCQIKKTDIQLDSKYSMLWDSNNTENKQ